MLKQLKSTSVIGIDISPLSINALQISRTEDNYRLDNFASELLPPCTVVDNQIRDTEVLSECIKKLLSKTNFSSKLTVLAVPDSAIITKTLQISSLLAEADIEDAVIREAGKHFSYSLNDINFDFVVQGISDMHLDRFDVLVTACRAEHVRSRVEAVENAGLKTRVVEIESKAMERVLLLLIKQCLQEKPKETIAIMNINKLVTNLYVAHKGKIIFTHEEPLGNHQGVEMFKPQYKSASNGQEESSLYMDLIVRQIKRMLQFFSLANSLNSIDHLFLAGDAVFSPNLCQRILEKIRIPVSVANPFAGMLLSQHISLHKIIEKGPALLIALGLALRTCD
ncbi:type IV pilus biogenesis protein PilM [Legionella cardiaca]|uniref:Type IV pilus assembly protein PilM n=1 Tax=Legionella cardiaca TaxID=1071983 RepID=A0ABY8AT38_9GAMM|nr:type IV pilus assembly protein PilM [Legionella cardiaca]WED43833.1 type IV pilus assembly protein PilM [Legionella cardiaca]